MKLAREINDMPDEVGFIMSDKDFEGGTLVREEVVGYCGGILAWFYVELMPCTIDNNHENHHFTDFWDGDHVPTFRTW